MLAERLSLFESGPIAIGHVLDCLKKRASRMLCRVRQGICALQGHNLLLHFETDRLSLRCATCGWDTPGWIVAAGLPATREHREPSQIKRLREVAV